jgi:hypothetical protein
MISNLTLFITGGICGIYIAQNYNIPNVKKYIENSVSIAKNVEESFRKK